MTQLTVRKSINKAYLKVQPQRPEINNFKAELQILLDSLNPNEHEEHNKNLLADFLKDSFYKGSHYINTVGRIDLVIHEKAKNETVC